MEVMEDGNLMDKINILIQRDMDYYIEHQTVLQEIICPGVIGGRLDFPRTVSFASMKIVRWWEEEYLAAYRKPSGFLHDERADEKLTTTAGGSGPGQGGCGGVVKASDPAKFISAVTKTAHQFLEHLHVLTQEALDHADLTVLTSTIGASALLKNYLWFYLQLISKAGKNVSSPEFDEVQLSYKKYQEMGEALAERLLDLHCRLLSLYILQDAESLDWENNKPFFESERGSYLVQMWWLYMQGTKQDLWNTVPPKMAERVFAGMLNETLTILAVRYSQAVPSKERSELYIVDMSNLLLCIAQLMTSISSNAEELCGLSLNIKSKVIRDIHAKCQELFICFLLRGAPLDILQKIMRQYLNNIQQLITFSYKPLGAAFQAAIVALQSTNLCTFLFSSLKKFLHTHPGLPSKTFRKGLDNVPILKPRLSGPSPWIVFAIPNVFSKMPKNRMQTFNDFPENCAITLELMVYLGQSEPNWPLLLKVFCMKECQILTIILHLALNEFDYLSHSFNYSSALIGNCGNFLCSGDSTCQGVDTSVKFCNAGHYYDLIYTCSVVVLSIGNTKDILEYLGLVIEKRNRWFDCFERKQVWNTKRPAWFAAIVDIIQPNLKPIVSTVLSAMRSGASMFQACTIVIAGFSQLLDCFNPAVTRFASILQELIPSHVTPLGNSVLFHFFISSLYSELLAASTEKTVRFSIGEDYETESQSSSCLALAEALCSIDEDNKHTDEINDLIKEAFSSLETDHVENEGVRRCEESEHVLEMTTSDLLEVPTGKKSMKVLNNFVQNNNEWLFQKLGMSEKTQAFAPNKVVMDSNKLLHIMFHIGYKPFDELLSGNWNLEWLQLFRFPMGLSIERVLTQISRRWEFRDSNATYLSPHELSIVNSVTAKLK